MRIGLTGLGRIGRLHPQRLADMGTLSGVVIHDRDQVTAQTVAGGHGFDVAEDLESLLQVGLDAVVIATPTKTHSDILRAAIIAGLPAFIEKPVTLTIEESVDLIRLADEHKALVQVGFMRRFDPGFRNCGIAVQSGILGFIHTIRANTNDVAPPSNSHIGSSGGIFLDASIHDVDAIRWVIGSEVRAVYGAGGNKGGGVFAQASDADTAGAVRELDDGTIALVSATRFNGAGHDVRQEVMGEIGSIAAGLDENLPVASAEPGVRLPRGEAEPAFTHRFSGAYAAELEAFFAAVENGAPSPDDARRPAGSADRGRLHPLASGTSTCRPRPAPPSEHCLSTV